MFHDVSTMRDGTFQRFQRAGNMLEGAFDNLHGANHRLHGQQKIGWRNTPYLQPTRLLIGSPTCGDNGKSRGPPLAFGGGLRRPRWEAYRGSFVALEFYGKRRHHIL
jgi:hypothetical protein